VQPTHHTPTGLRLWDYRRPRREPCGNVADLLGVHRYARSPMPKVSTERTRASAWQSWESWCRLHGYEPLGARTALAEYLQWLVDPYGGNLGASSANLAYWAVRSTLLHSGWRDPARDPAVTAALTLIRHDDELASRRRRARRFTREEIEQIVAAIPVDSPRGLRDRALLWLGHEGSMRAGELTTLRWRHVAFAEFEATVRVLGNSPKDTRIITLYESEEPLAALVAWREVRRRRPAEPVFVSIPWNDLRVSSTPLSTSDVTRIVMRRSLDVGLGRANASSLMRHH
jgi:integrase